MLKHNISDAPVWKRSTDFALPYGVIDQLLCTVGFRDEKNGNYSVRSYFLFFFDDLISKRL